MPELPDLTIYLDALERRLDGARLEAVHLRSPFVLRSVAPPLAVASGRCVEGLRRIGKRLVIVLEGELFLVIHLMIAGRLHWSESRRLPRSRSDLASLEFSSGTLRMTERAKKKRAWVRLMAGEATLRKLDPGGAEPLEASDAELRSALARENRTLKRALTDPRLLAAIGNAYSDEILWRARLSPLARTGQLGEAAWASLLAAIRETLREWIDRLRDETEGRFPAKVTAFREAMAVHGKFGRACPRCGGAVQRLVYAEREANYCPSCQTGGKLLADRALSRLMHGDWPRTLEELEERKATARVGRSGSTDV